MKPIAAAGIISLAIVLAPVARADANDDFYPEAQSSGASGSRTQLVNTGNEAQGSHHRLLSIPDVAASIKRDPASGLASISRRRSVLLPRDHRMFTP
jgi:hypothetical protein